MGPRKEWLHPDNAPKGSPRKRVEYEIWRSVCADRSSKKGSWTEAFEGEADEQVIMM